MKILRKLLLVRMVINIADSLFYMATIWMLSDGANAATYTGIAVALFTLPELLTFLVGPIIDKINPRKILLSASITQILIQILVVFSLVNHQKLVILPLIFLSSLLSMITYPIEEVMIPKLVEQSKIVLANSLFSFSYQTLDIIVNSLSSFLLIWLSFRNMYLLAMAFFILAVLLLFRFKFQTEKEAEKYEFGEYFSDIKSGATYFLQHEMILKLSIPLVLLNLFNSVNAVALPFFVRDFKDSLLLLGGMGLATGLGGMVSNLFTHKLSQIVSSGKLIIILMILDGFLRLTGLLLGQQMLILAFFFLASLCSGIYNTVFSSLYQMIPKEEYIGRIGTFVDSFIGGAMPLGGILGAFFLSLFGGQTTLMFSPFLTLLAGFYYLWDKKVSHLPMINKIERET